MLVVVATIVWIGLALSCTAAAEAEHDPLRASGSAPAGSRQGTLKVASSTGEVQLDADRVVPELLQSQRIAGAPCEDIVDPAELCITAIGDVFGVATPVDLGTLDSRG